MEDVVKTVFVRVPCRNGLSVEKEPRVAYFVDPLRHDPEKGYQACIAKEDESGYFLTDWFWGHDLKIAEQCAREKNEAMGLTENDVHQIICATMFKRKRRA